jgi:hypothetical protein
MTEIVKGPLLAAEVDPRRGAKIVSLRDPRGQEWLSQAEAGAAPGASFLDAEMAGWDECAPSIDACTIDGHRIPDHGDLWNSPFEMSGAIARGHGDGYLFERAIEPTPRGLRLSYRVEASRRMPFLWAAHPQFAAPHGTRIALPGDNRVVFEVSRKVLRRRQWSTRLDGIDSVRQGTARKYFLAPDERSTWAAIVRPDAAALRLSWSQNCRYLGLWFDNARFNRGPVVAIEPSTGFYDSAKRAMRRSRVTWIEPGLPTSWHVEIDYWEPGSWDSIERSF